MTILHHQQLTAAATTIKNGGIIVYPTDTIWGIGCDALQPDVVQKLKRIKGKPDDAALIWLLPSVKAVVKYCGPVTPLEQKLLKQKRTSVIINGQAVRVVTHGWLNKLLTRCGTPLIATSANRHGEPVITSWRQGAALFGDQVTVIRGRKIYQNQPSTLIKVVNGQPEILREQIIRPGGGISIK